MATPRLVGLAGLAALSLLLGGCAGGVSHHFVKAARVDMAAPATLPALNLSTGEEKPLVGLRISQAGPTRGQAGTKTDTSAFNDTTSDRRHGYYGYPGNYRIEREPFLVGLDFQSMINRVFDLFLSLEAAPTLDGRGSAVVGMGLTYPSRWVGLRAAPALTLHRYQLAVTDSIHTYEDLSGGGTLETEEVVSEDLDRVTLGMGGSLSAWIPGALTGIPFTPFVQYQYNVMWVSSSTLPTTVLALRAQTWSGGFDYETSFGHAQARISQESIAGQGPGWIRSYRVQTALLFNLRD